MIIAVSILGALVGLGLAVFSLTDYGTYRWSPRSRYHGPAPWFHLIVRPAHSGWARVEVGLFGRCFYVTWNED